MGCRLGRFDFGRLGVRRFNIEPGTAEGGGDVVDDVGKGELVLFERASANEGEPQNPGQELGLRPVVQGIGLAASEHHFPGTLGAVNREVVLKSRAVEIDLALDKGPRLVGLAQAGGQLAAGILGGATLVR